MILPLLYPNAAHGFQGVLEPVLVREFPQLWRPPLASKVEVVRQLKAAGQSIVEDRILALLVRGLPQELVERCGSSTPLTSGT